MLHGLDTNGLITNCRELDYIFKIFSESKTIIINGNCKILLDYFTAKF